MKTSKEEIENLVDIFSKAKQALELGMDITRQKNTKDPEKLSTFRIKMQPFLSDEEYLLISLTDVLVGLTRIQTDIKYVDQAKTKIENLTKLNETQEHTLSELTDLINQHKDVALQLKAKLELHIMNNAALRSALLWFHVMSGKQGVASYPPEIQSVLTQVIGPISDGVVPTNPNS